ncbi:unnamed protein product [Symbiodinium natans]|uniref:Uncharacterized protein n=1 Tax=Symbiodinium natans TaxID=878477 RepID=A0A812KTU8_9DINO|nr:unnamed protein product [Symbiodinium natans]
MSSLMSRTNTPSCSKAVSLCIALVRKRLGKRDRRDVDAWHGMDFYGMRVERYRRCLRCSRRVLQGGKMWGSGISRVTKKGSSCRGQVDSLRQDAKHILLG